MYEFANRYCARLFSDEGVLGRRELRWSCTIVVCLWKVGRVRSPVTSHTPDDRDARRATIKPMLPAALVSMASVVPARTRALGAITGDACALGFDFGTSGVRCTVVDAAGAVIASPHGYSWGESERSQAASDWEAALFSQLEALPLDARARIQRIAFSGTSGTMLLVDEEGTPTPQRGLPRMYDFSVKKQAAGSSGEVRTHA